MLNMKLATYCLLLAIAQLPSVVLSVQQWDNAPQRNHRDMIRTTYEKSSHDIPFLRGVNLGGWLVLEKWMNPNTFVGAFANASDQWAFDAIPGAAAALETHWNTFFTKEDIEIIAATGINAIRIPIGFWSYDNIGTPYLKGADHFLEIGIQWAREAGLKVWVDLHGAPGSQNGFDNSGHAGTVEWQRGDNLQRTITVLEIMAKKYGSLQYADVVLGLELLNEPISWVPNKFNVTQNWTIEAYKAVRAASTNSDLQIVMHDSFQGALSWKHVVETLHAPDRAFALDSHLYQVFVPEDKNLTHPEHIAKTCGWAKDLTAANKLYPTYVAEWSAAMDICVYQDGTTKGATSCSATGCQCQSDAFEDWNAEMIELVRRYIEAQLDVYESSTSGYFSWSAKGPGPWGFLNMIKIGAWPNPVTSRKFPGQCTGGTSTRR